MQRSPFGIMLIGLGVVLVIAGVLVWTGALGWFGRLPGDIRVERPGTRIYVPLTSMILLSVLATLLLAAVRRFWP